MGGGERLLATQSRNMQSCYEMSAKEMIRVHRCHPKVRRESEVDAHPMSMTDEGSTHDGDEGDTNNGM